VTAFINNNLIITSISEEIICVQQQVLPSADPASARAVADSPAAPPAPEGKTREPPPRRREGQGARQFVPSNFQLYLILKHHALHCTWWFSISYRVSNEESLFRILAEALLCCEQWVRLGGATRFCPLEYDIYFCPQPFILLTLLQNARVLFYFGNEKSLV
jgi:hypothetical protein